MLVLSRKLGETIIIDGHIKVTVCQIDRGKVRLAIEAPREVPIHRSELLERQPAPSRAPVERGYVYIEEAVAQSER